MKIVEMVRANQQTKKLRKITTNLEDISKVFQALDDVVRKTRVQRFLIFKGSNGGGIPKPGCPFYVSLIYEEHKDKNKSLRDKYSNLSVDGSYIDMLIHLYKNGSVKLRVEDMPVGLLKTLYQGEGIKYSEIYFLGNSDKEILFCSVATNTGVETFDTPSDRAEIEIAVNHLKNIFAKYYH